MQYCQQIGIRDVDVEDIYIGNGVSELVVMSIQALVDNGDEILIPAPDFPLWTAAVNLCGGRPVHYLCDEGADWQPDLTDIRAKITPNTKAIVIINPNNPTGAVYERAMLEALIDIAREYDLVVFTDEIYDKVIYDDASYIACASLADDLLFLTLSGLSKSYRVAGFRAGWLVVSGAKQRAQDYVEGLDILASMRLCSNVPAQHAIQTALGGYQSINELITPGGRLYEQRNLAWQMLDAIDGISCVKPRGALYLFPKIDTRKFNIRDDEQFTLDLLQQEKVLVVQGTGFNWPEPDHFRVVFLPHIEDLEEAIGRLERFLATYRQ
jgi:alanine-synthesizing transaminase